MDLAAHFAAMWRHRWVVLVASVLVAVLVFAAFSLGAKVYEANAELSVSVGGGGSNGQSISQTLPFLASTYSDMAQTRPVVAAAAKLSGLRISEDTAASRISVSTPGSIGFVELTATGPSLQDAVALDKGLSVALVNQVQAQQQQALQPLQAQAQQLAAQIAALPTNSAKAATLQTQYQAVIQSIATAQAQAISLTVVSPAQGSSSPVSPKPKTDAALAFVTSLVVLAELSVGYELLSDRFSRTTRDEEIRRLTGLPVLARIPRGPGPELVEAFRTLRTSLLFVNGSSKSRTISIVSSAPEVGKSFVSINLASSFADLGIHAALVDGDMRRPAIASRLGLGDSPGLSEALNGRDVAETLLGRRTDSGFNLFVMPAGAPAPDPAALLTSRLAEWVFPGLSGFDAIVVDTPAESVFPDASIIASRCEAAVIVIDATNTKRRSLKALLDHLREIGAHPQGVVVNRVAEPARVGRYYSRGAYYSRSAEAERASRAP